MLTRIIVILILAVSLTSFTRAQTVQWAPAAGGNGHFYQVVSVPQGIVWTDANDLADQTGGHLVTITSPQENAFVFSLINYAAFWNGNCGPLIGGYQPPGSPEPDGGWRWVTGEPFIYTNWMEGQPNNTGQGDEECIHFGWGVGITPFWNDLDENFTQTPAVAYIIEYDQPLCSEIIPADLNGDCIVNLLDLALFASYWLDCTLIPASACP